MTKKRMTVPADDAPAASAAPASLRPAKGAPVRFGKYLLLERIAVGGMAEVYLGKSVGVSGFEKLVAIKRIRPAIAGDQHFIAMFIDEAKIAGRLQHANIVPIYELGQIGGAYYIAMEYVRGRNLRQVSNALDGGAGGGRLPPPMAAFIASNVCDALSYAHAVSDSDGRPLNLIHRDVSPHNIIVGYDGQVKLIDFGVAKATTRKTETQVGVVKGKVDYMSPEQVRGQPLDLRADIFSLGTCLYEMLSGVRPFTDNDPIRVLTRVRSADALPLGECAPDVPAALAEIVGRAMTLDPGDRYQSAEEMQRDLEMFLAKQKSRFGAPQLAAWMQRVFAKEHAREAERMAEYASVSMRIPNLDGDYAPTDHEIDISDLDYEEVGTGSIHVDAAAEVTQIFFSAEAMRPEEQLRVFEEDVAGRPVRSFGARRFPVWLAFAAGAVLSFGLTALAFALMAPMPPSGSLYVELSPPVTASVFVDGELRGAAPLRVEALSPGAHRIAVRGAAVASVEREVRVRSGVDTFVIVGVHEPPPRAATAPKEARASTPSPTDITFTELEAQAADDAAAEERRQKRREAREGAARAQATAAKGAHARASTPAGSEAPPEPAAPAAPSASPPSADEAVADVSEELARFLRDRGIPGPEEPESNAPETPAPVPTPPPPPPPPPSSSPEAAPSPPPSSGGPGAPP